MARRFLYQEEVYHRGLNKYRIVKAETFHELEEKKRALMAQWNEQWDRKVEREAKIKNEEDSISYAAELTQQSNIIQQGLDNLLINHLDVKPLNFNELKDFSEYSEPYPKVKNLIKIPKEPEITDSKYNPAPFFLMRFSKKKMKEFSNNNIANYESDHSVWEKQKNEISEQNKEIISLNNTLVSNWKKEKTTFMRTQAEKNQQIDTFSKGFMSGDKKSVEKIYTLFLERIKLPFDYNLSIDAEYHSKDKFFIIDILLPSVEDIPTLKSVQYIKSRKEFKKNYYSDSYFKRKYDSVNYQIILMILNYIFDTSPNSLINMVTINGKINTIDKSTGQNISPYILSVNVSRSSFKEINLKSVDPKAWFKSAKGVSASSLANVTPIAPVISMSRNDKRFIEGYNISSNLDSSVNLAAIDWQDFENLIREIFEKEFNTTGGEVKITRASRDGGVDAIAFDPDPIRGGKIVIQAKRYTNTVGVSAVRDLYGTILNEGATKGILVTTSNYGNDAYNFAQGKPITLMNGANLLYLLDKHGYHAKIDLKEAKEILKNT